MKKTKIICTMGPATADDEVLKEIMRSGMDVARINFSHGNGAEHLPKVEQIKRLREDVYKRQLLLSVFSWMRI